MKTDSVCPLRLSTAIAGTILACGLGVQVRAQQFAPQVNPGAIGRQNQQSIQSLPDLQEIPPLTGPTVTGPGQPAGPTVAPGGPTFVLERVIFSPSALLAKSDVEAVAIPYLGRRVDLSQLYQIVGAVNALYAKRGVPNAVAVLPPEHISDGVVHINLVEGRLDKVTVDGDAHIHKAFVLARVRLRLGEVLDVPRLSHDIAVFNRINDVQTRAALQPGTKFGQTELTFSMVEPPRNTLDVIVDNFGVASTGSWEGAVLYRRRDFAVDDDIVTLYGVGNPGDLTGNISYDFPIDKFGGRLSATYSYTDTKVLHGPYKSLAINGHSQSVSAQLSQPVYATEHWLASLLLNYSNIQTVSNQGAEPQTHDATNKGGGGGLLSYIDAGTLAEATFSYAYGSTRDAVMNDTLNYGLAGGSFRFQHRLPAQFSLNVAGSWQFTPANRLSPDQLLSLGGATSVRGYDSNLVAGLSGAFGQVEFYRAVGRALKGLSMFGFVDAGTVSSPSSPRATLVGVGAGASYALNHLADLQLSVGAPLRHVVQKQSSVGVYLRLVVHAL